MDLADKIQQLQDELKRYSVEPKQEKANERPAERFLPQHADCMPDARDRPAAPAPTAEPIKETEHVATQMEYKPNGNQPAPSVNGPGMSWTNPRANWKPQGQDQPELSQASERQPSRSEDLADKVNREFKEEYAKGRAIERGVERVNDMACEEAERRQREQDGRGR